MQNTIIGIPFKVLICIIITVMSSLALGELSVANLTTAGRINPLGIGTDKISFSWSIISDKRGEFQRAYNIRVGTINGSADIWNSGEIASDKQFDIPLPADVKLNASTRYYWQVKVFGERDAVSDWSEPAWFETGLLSSEDWKDAEWIISPIEQDNNEKKTGKISLPIFRKIFNSRDQVVSARIYASAQGIYSLQLNGEKVGNQFLAPGWTDYNHRIQVQTYDVTDLIIKGDNSLGVALADGWYRGNVGIRWPGVYGKELAFIAKIKLTYKDGSIEWFESDNSWQADAGPFQSADLQDGENFDARLEQPGWSTAGFNAEKWKTVATITGDVKKLVPQPDEPIRITEVLTAKAITSPIADSHIYDIGQNMVGVARITMTGKKDQVVTIRYAEELYRTGERKGQLYTENFRSARVTDTYTFATDGTVTYQPTFTQHGFRYIELKGLEIWPEPEKVKGIVLGSDLPDVGKLETSNLMLNKLLNNIKWGLRGNFLSIPTDTPARDERLGWTGDINVFAPTACRLKDTRSFLTKWMDDMRDAQKQDGNIPAIIPQPLNMFDETGVGWSDAFITVPYAVWHSTGDTLIVRKNWDAMQKFYQFIYESATKDGNLIEEGRSSWFSGDWLNLENADRLEEHKVIATAYFVEDTRMMAEMADALGEKDKAAKWKELVGEIASAFVSTFCQQDGSVYTNTQTVYSMALGMNLIDNPEMRERVAVKFIEKLANDNYHLKTGFLGTPWLLPALSGIGREDLAMRLLLNEDYPSWGFEISMGATTMWERWNTIRADGSFGPVDMNSFNHYAYGAVADWMFSQLGGLQIIEPGYKKVRIAPLIGIGGLNYANCDLRTPYGLLVSKWRLIDGKLTLSVSVPTNTTAEIVIPATDAQAVYEGNVLAISAEGVKNAEFKNGKLILQVYSGNYEFNTAILKVN